MFRKTVNILFPLLLAAVLGLFGMLGVYAEDMPGEGEASQSSAISEETEYVEPQTEYVPPQTEYVEPETEYVAPETEYVAPETEAPQIETQAPEQPATRSVQDEYIALIDDAQEPTNNIAPQMDKSVSNKSYSTDYTAGIVSWICVGVGVIVVIVMLVSTKITGKSTSRRII